MRKILIGVVSLILASCAADSINHTLATTNPAQTPSPEARSTLRAELENMFELDQKMRRTLNGLSVEERTRVFAQIREVDLRNQARLDEIFSQVAWPKASVFGARAAEAAFLIVQHSNQAMMKKYFEAMRLASEEGELSKSSFALLVDRVRMNDGKMQLYGSQFRSMPMSNEFCVWPVEDWDNLDKRRAAMGLGTFADNAKRQSGMESAPYRQCELPVALPTAAVK
jgi:hypothetical protein